MTPNSTRSRLRRALAYAPALAWMAVIFKLSSIPGSDLPGGYSTLGHLVAYAILGALLALALRRDSSAGRSVALAVLIASAYGATDEFHQHFVAMRTPDIVDWGVDTVGALVGAMCASALAAATGSRDRRRERI